MVKRRYVTKAGVDGRLPARVCATTSEAHAPSPVLSGSGKDKEMQVGISLKRFTEPEDQDRQQLCKTRSETTKLVTKLVR